MNDDVVVSVLCTAYNHEKYIRSALDGFVNQKTNFRYEVLINDDASTDHTAAIIAEYEAKHPDIIKPVYQTENQYSKGVSITKSILFPQSKGKYTAICEGDDYWCDENKLQKQVDFLESHQEYAACLRAVRRGIFCYLCESAWYDCWDPSGIHRLQNFPQNHRVSA